MGIQAGSLQVWDTRTIFVGFILLVVLLGLAAVATYLYTLYFRKGAFFEVNGVRLFYVEAGQGTPVILVHGLAAAATAGQSMHQTARILLRVIPAAPTPEPR